MELLLSGAGDQVERSLRQARRMAGEDGKDILRVETDGATPVDLAAEILRKVGWLPA